MDSSTLTLTPGLTFSVAAASFVVYTLGTYAYNLWFHPLRKIPGPWLAGMSRMWISYQDICLTKAQAIEAAFKKYGPVVRIEPNVVAFVDPATQRFVYSTTSKFSKSAFYKALLTNENDHAMTTLETSQHAPKKRAYAPHYTPNNLSLYQPEMREFISQMLEKLDAYDGKRAFDCLVLFRRMLVDIIFYSSYGQRINSLKQWDIETFKADDASVIVESINLFPIRGVFRASVPVFVWDLLIKLPVAGWQKLVNSDRRIAEYVIRARDAIVARDLKLQEGQYDMDGETDERLSLIHRLLRQQVSAKIKPEERLSDKDIISEGMGHTIAGVDTSATSLSYMMYVLSTRPDVLAKLREEIDPLMPAGGSERAIPDYLVLNKLPYLTGFVKETLRLYGAAPSLLERVVPSDLTIGKHTIPAGAVVGTQAYSVHRIESIFPDPEAFKPERWLEETEEMRAVMMPFGYGGRLCGGMNLAHFTLRLATAAIIRNFDIVAPPETTKESMDVRYAFVLLPAGQKVNLIFKKRELAA